MGAMYYNKVLRNVPQPHTVPSMPGSEESLRAQGRERQKAHVGGLPGLSVEMNGMKLPGCQISAQAPGPAHLLTGPALLSPPLQRCRVWLTKGPLGSLNPLGPLGPNESELEVAPPSLWR